jgi:GMP synthase-like glutamine amidotransferase
LRLVKVHYLQHSPTEGPGEIANWAAARGYEIAGTHWYRGDASPDPADIDLLAIMGGGMNIYEHRNHPWLVPEKQLIAEVIRLGKPVLGICLGAQLVADAMGGVVFQNPEYEIGWWPVRFSKAARENPLFRQFPETLTALHWHGDTFELPGVAMLGESEACPNQAFACGEKVVGLQFHAEVTPADVRAFVQGETEPLPAGKYVQSFEEIMDGDAKMPPVHKALWSLLDALAE